MSEEAKQLAHRWFDEVWNQKSEAAIDRMYHPEGRSHGLPTEAGRPAGREDFKKIHAMFLGAFPDMRIAVDDVIAEGDRVAIRWTATMTHTGDQLGFPATGMQVALEGSTFLRLKDGKIFEGWNQMELQGMIHSLKSASEKALQA
jgi:steroid delta-isomerase-like uncharacterized protein